MRSDVAVSSHPLHPELGHRHDIGALRKVVDPVALLLPAGRVAGRRSRRVRPVLAWRGC